MKNRELLLLVLFLIPAFLIGQSSFKALSPGFDDSPRGFYGARIMFYNAENLFDFTHDSLKRDDDFLPDGIKHWDKRKYWAKQNNIAKVITAVGGWEMPSIVGLAEIENIHVLLNLAYNTQLKSTHYRIIHHESPDRRGIDVAMLYREEKFEPLFDSAISIRFPFDTASRTRDILYVKGVLFDKDTIHFFITHWPSKYGGAFVTIPKRMYVAEQIRHFTDSLLREDPKAKILIMGDLNDGPQEKSLTEGLRAGPPGSNNNYKLINLMIPLQEANAGSHFYKGATGAEWSVLDQFIVSKALFEAQEGIRIKGQRAYIFRADFLLETNENGTLVPNRSYIGMKYHGGYSDHLPVYLDLIYKK